MFLIINVVDAVFKVYLKKKVVVFLGICHELAPPQKGQKKLS